MSTDDWARSRPTTVDIRKLIKRNPKHKDCKLHIHRSAKNQFFKGLYCKEHDHLLTWVNYEQCDWLNSLGIE
jgi:hypothetical protein